MYKHIIQIIKSIKITITTFNKCNNHLRKNSLILGSIKSSGSFSYKSLLF